MLEEAEKVARAAGLPALDIGTNTASGLYQDLRRFGLQVFYESDRILCQCVKLAKEKLPDCRMLSQAEFNPTGLLRVNHWAPTDFDFTHEPGRPPMQEFIIDGHRVIADFWRLWEPEQQAPINCVFAPPKALHSPTLMTKILKATATIAASLGAGELGLPYPSALPLAGSPAWVKGRKFEWAWVREKGVNITGSRKGTVNKTVEISPSGNYGKYVHGIITPIFLIFPSFPIGTNIHGIGNGMLSSDSVSGLLLTPAELCEDVNLLFQVLQEARPGKA